MKLLEPAFMSFMKDEIIRGVDCRFSVDSRLEIVDLLLKWIDDGIEKEKLETKELDAFEEEGRDRRLIVERMVQEFVKSVLFMNFEREVLGEFGSGESKKKRRGSRTLFKRVFNRD